LEFLRTLLDFAIHLDVHLHELIDAYGLWTYGILWLIIFAETGLVVTPFLPGDSLLFAAGAIAATQVLDVHTLFLLLTVAAILGNATNYSFGHIFGPGIARRGKSRFINGEYLDRAHAFFERHGGKTIILARFLPILRTFVPFVAGMSSMSYGRYTLYNVVAAVCWVGAFIYGGYYFGNLPYVKSNFSLVIMAIIVVSMLPAVIGYLRHRMRKKGAPSV
jgi:membrane-associated protein